MEDNSFKTKMILINLVYMYKQINGDIPTLKKMEDIISKIDIEIKHDYIKNFLEKLQKINFEEAEVNGRKRIDFIKKQKPIIVYKATSSSQIINNDINIGKKETNILKKEEASDVDVYRSQSDTEDVLPDLFDM